MSKVKVVIASVEQAIYVEPTSGLHGGGSCRSILVQFNLDIDYGSPLVGTVEVGDGVSRGTSDISKTSVSWELPVVACLPTDADYLISTDLVLMPNISVLDVPGTPQYLVDYHSDFVEWGDKHWAHDGSAQTPWPSEDPTYYVYNYYDRAHLWFNWWVRTGEYKWWYRGMMQEAAYLAFTIPMTSNNMHAPNNWLPAGMAEYYLLTGRDVAKSEFIRATMYCKTYYGGSYSVHPTGDSRIQSRLLESFIWAIQLGDTSQTWSAWASDWLTKILDAQAANGSYSKFTVWNEWDSHLGDGGDALGVSGDWADQGSNIWRRAWEFSITNLTFNDTVTGTEDLTPESDYDWYRSGGFLSVYATSNPAGYYTALRSSAWSDLGGNVWRRTLGFNLITAIKFNTDTIGVEDATPAADYEWRHDGTYLDVYATEDPATYYTQIWDWTPKHSPYQTGMVHYVFYLYYTYINADALIQPAMEAALDYEIANGWIAGTKSIRYIIPTSNNGSPDLSGLSLFGYIWNYELTSTATYLNYAIDLLQGIHSGAWLYGYKQFVQAYRQSTPFMKWRV
jgi:hypothetical protein